MELSFRTQSSLVSALVFLPALLLHSQVTEALFSPFEEKYTSETGFQKMLLRVLFLTRGK